MALEITIISAKHLKNVNWRNGELTPYAVVSLDNTLSSLLSTKPDLSGSTRPVWNERFVIPLSNSHPPPPQFLSLQVFHSGQPDIPVGSVSVSVYGFDDPTRIRTLELRRPSGRPHGKIRIKLRLIATPPPIPLQDYPFAPPVSNCYSSAPSVSNCNNSSRPVSSCYSSTRPTLPASLPPRRFSGQVQDHDFTPVSCNYDSATAPPVPRPYPPPQRPGSWKPSGQSQVYEVRPPILCNYDSATPPVFPCVIRPPPPQQSASLQVKDYTFSPLFPYNYDSATAPLAPSPLPPRQSSLQAQEYSFSPPVSCNYDSATVIGSLPAQQSSGQAQDYNFSPPVSCNYDSATAPPVPSPPPPQQSGSLPAQESSGQSQDYNFTPLVSYNYNSATASPPCQQTYPPPQPESGILPPPQHTSPQAQGYSFAPPSLRNYDAAPPPGCPRPPQQYAYRQGYENDYQKLLRPNCSGEQPSALVDYNAQYNGDNMNGSGCFGDEVALARAMRGMVLVESDLGSQSGDSEYSRSYSAQPSAPVMRGSDDYGMF